MDQFIKKDVGQERVTTMIRLNSFGHSRLLILALMFSLVAGCSKKESKDPRLDALQEESSHLEEEIEVRAKHPSARSVALIAAKYGLPHTTVNSIIERYRDSVESPLQELAVDPDSSLVKFYLEAIAEKKAALRVTPDYVAQVLSTLGQQFQLPTSTVASIIIDYIELSIHAATHDVDDVIEDRYYDDNEW